MDLQHMENGIGGGGGGGSTAGGVNSMQTSSETDYQKLSTTITNSLQKIQQDMSKMQRMINQCNTPQDSPDLKKELHQCMTYTNNLVSDTSNHLKEIEKCKDRHFKIQKDRLVDEFTSALNQFQNLQRKTVEIEKNQLRQARANQYNIGKPPGNTNNSSNGGSNSFFEDNNIFGRKGQQQQTQMQEEIDLQALEEQERAIRNLEQNIVSVNEIYKTLGTMVYEQGLVVDSIESSVEQTSIYVSQGADNLRVAGSYKNKLRKKKLILLGIASLILLILLLIIIMQLRN